MQAINEVKHHLHQNFKIKDLGNLRYFLGIELARSEKGIVLNQRKYILDLISNIGLGGAKPLGISMEQNVRLTTEEKVLADNNRKKKQKRKRKKEDPLLQEPSTYRHLVGRLSYLTTTRPDLCYVVQTLSQFLSSPRKSHMEAAVCVVQYLKGSLGVEVLLSRSNINALEYFVDSDWDTCNDSRRFVFGYLVKFGGSLVCWKSKKQSTISRSSAKAEYRALGSAVVEVTWLTRMLKYFGLTKVEPVKVFCDSKATIHIASNPVFHKKTKHIEIDCHFVREKLQ